MIPIDFTMMPELTNAGVHMVSTEPDTYLIRGFKLEIPTIPYKQITNSVPWLTKTGSSG